MKYCFYLFLLSLFCLTQSVAGQNNGGSLEGKTICLDAGHGGTAKTDSFRKGPAGEREEWINLRVALLLQEMLEGKGAKVIMTRTGDDTISLSRRAKLAKDHNADLFLSIHHNATADKEVNFPIIYFHGYASENRGSVAFAKEIASALIEHMYQGEGPKTIVSDHTIFPKSGAGVLRNTYGIPAVIAEASFFTNPEEEGRLKQVDHNRREALGYLSAIENFFADPVPPILEKNSLVKIPPFHAFQEAERMNDAALNWYRYYLKGKELMQRKDNESLQEALELFTRSARSFPDSYIAKECHENRAILLDKLGKPEEAAIAGIRSKEFYVAD